MSRVCHVENKNLKLCIASRWATNKVLEAIYQICIECRYHGHTISMCYKFARESACLAICLGETKIC